LVEIDKQQQNIAKAAAQNRPTEERAQVLNELAASITPLGTATRVRTFIFPELIAQSD
jgi:hypothetical protein